MDGLIEYAYLAESPVFKNRNNSAHFIEANKQDLLRNYDFLVRETNRQFLENSKDYTHRLNCFEAKVCYKCGAKLRLNNEWNFWGCENYRIGCKNTYNADFPTIYLKPVTIYKNWIGYIIQETGMVGKINPKSLYNWFIDSGFEDLKIKFGGYSTEKSFTGYTTAKTNSYAQEQEALSHFKTFYKKVLYQQCIKYKLKGGKEHFCIPDFICSNEKAILVIDCKLSGSDMCDDKMTLYVSLVRHIAKDKNDFRPVSGCFCLKNIHQSDYNKTKFTLIKIH